MSQKSLVEVSTSTFNPLFKMPPLSYYAGTQTIIEDGRVTIKVDFDQKSIEIGFPGCKSVFSSIHETDRRLIPRQQPLQVHHR